MNIKRRRAFTLIEMLIVIAIISILAALIFPSFSAAREDARQKTCSSNLREIGLAVQMYRTEEREYPMSLGALLPAGRTPVVNATVRLNNVDGGTMTPPVTAIDGDNAVCNNSDPTKASCSNVGGTGYLRDTKYLLCPDDRSTSNQPRSSYGDLSTGIPNLPLPTATPVSNEDLSRRTWNFWGYRDDGVAYNNQAAAQLANGGTTMPVAPAINTWLVDSARKYVAPDTLPVGASPALEDYRTNVVKNSLSNRFAPPNTIITYCPYHRVFSAKVSDNNKLYDPAEDAKKTAGARDLVLRLDGTVKSIVVSSWKTTTPTDPNYQMWQQQTFR